MDLYETSDLLDHFKLDAEILPEYTLHVTTKSDPALGLRKQRIETRWYQKKLLGRGSFGHVYLETDSQGDENSQSRAVKILNKDDMQYVGVDYRKEIAALAKLSKPQYSQEGTFVPLYGWFETQKDIFLSMEFYPLGDLACHIDGTATEVEAKEITSDLLAGLKIMHREGFVHRDLKPKSFEQNVFVVQRPPASKTWWVKIGDFGLAKRVRNDQSAFRSMVGTQAYMAPEILKMYGTVKSSTVLDHYSSAVDLWSLGCIIYEVLGNSRPFQESSSIQQYCRGKSMPIENLVGRLDSDGLQFLRRLLSIKPDERPTAQVALETPWLKKSTSSWLPDKTSSHAYHTESTQMTIRSTPQQGIHNDEDQARTTRLKAPSRIPATEMFPSQLIDSPAHIASFALRSHANERNEKQEEAMQILVLAGYVPSKGSSHANAFVYAAGHGNDEALRLYIESGIDVDAPVIVDGADTRNRSTSTALCQAVLADHVTTVRILLNARADTQTMCTFHTNNGHIGTDYALHRAARSSPTISRLLLDAGAVMEAKNSLGWTALHVAARCGNLEVFRLLLAVEANVNTKDLFGLTPLYAAVNSGNLEVVQLLLNAGSNIEALSKSGDTPLVCAVYKGDLEIIRLLTERGASLSVKGFMGRSLLQNAVRSVQIDVVRFLLDTRPDMEWKDLHGFTALNHVIFPTGTESARVSIARLLLDKGSFIDAITPDGQTTLHMASLIGQLEMVRMLLKGGATPTGKDKWRETPRDIARREGHKDVLALLDAAIPRPKIRWNDQA
ncbi:hypothetical protein MMC18_007088 [Xylographa bjoerkii]|nr:hypothetical protein [Xylographa bjoerkii]